MRAVLSLSVIGAAGVVFSLAFLPFYGLAEPSNQPWPFDIVGTTSALDSGLGLEPSRFLIPGSQSIGFLVLGLSATVALLACVTSVLAHHPVSRLPGTVEVASTTLPVVTLMEWFGRPPFGDGPPLQASWGAAVAIGAAFISCLASWAALGLAHRKQPLVAQGMA